MSMKRWSTAQDKSQTFLRHFLVFSPMRSLSRNRSLLLNRDWRFKVNFNMFNQALSQFKCLRIQRKWEGLVNSTSTAWSVFLCVFMCLHTPVCVSQGCWSICCRNGRFSSVFCCILSPAQGLRLRIELMPKFNMLSLTECLCAVDSGRKNSLSSSAACLTCLAHNPSLTFSIWTPPLCLCFSVPSSPSL